MKKLLILSSLILLVPTQTFSYHGRGGGSWVGPALVGGTMAGLTTAAIASSNNSPRTVVIEQAPQTTQTYDSKQKIRHLKKQFNKVIHDNKQLVKMIKELKEQNEQLKKWLNLNQTAQ